jgi:hypothetical protein
MLALRFDTLFKSIYLIINSKKDCQNLKQHFIKFTPTIDKRQIPFSEIQVYNISCNKQVSTMFY